VSATPPVRRRLLGSALRQYREGHGYKLEEAAAILECHPSKISRIETGERGIRAKELRELLTEYSVPAAEQEALLAIAHRGRQVGWWLDYGDVLSADAQDYVIMESAATEILIYEPNQVPDLLQTPGYLRAVADADARYTSAEQRAHGAEVKLSRQRVVRAGQVPELDVVVTEGALRQAVGPPWVMREQLGLLAAVAETGLAPAFPAGCPGGAGPGWSLRVLPFAAGAHAAAGSGPMTVLRFAQAPALGVVHLPALSGGISLEGRDDVARYLRTFTGLRAAALDAPRSARLLRALAGRYGT
jgi:transcriptional regulator with XRE-family HTH domain